MTETTDLPRETGAEKATVQCGTCGGELELLTSAYGGTSPAACSKCYPASQKAAADGSSLPRETATPLATPPAGSGG